jgi:hypothetical protein
MNNARYPELLGRLLEGELSEPDVTELARELSASPALQHDLHRHLVLWEVWSQHQTPERSAEAFAAAWKTRLRAESEGTETFYEMVRARLETRPVGVLSWMTALWGTLRRPAGIAWAASVAVAGLVLVFWLAIPRTAQAMITIQGEALCPACVLHEGHQHIPAIRVQKGGTTLIYYLERSPALAAGQEYFCMGPNPITVEGKPRTEGGRVLLEVSRAVLPPPPPKPRDDQRILFPL